MPGEMQHVEEKELEPPVRTKAGGRSSWTCACEKQGSCGSRVQGTPLPLLSFIPTLKLHTHFCDILPLNVKIVLCSKLLVLFI